MTKSREFAASPRKSCPSCGMQLDPQATICPRDGTYLEPSLSRDAAFAKYEFQESVGAGGMGIIYKARHLILNKVMAIKTMHSHLSSPEAIRRFQIEGKATSSLSHQNIIAVHDFGVTEAGQAYMIMDFVNGKTLSDVLRLTGQLPIPRFLNIFTQVCNALSHAHSRSVLHRDIKPSNIMLLVNEKGEEEVRIMDFGIAKILSDTGDSANNLTKTGDAIGSPSYMSPEQAKGAKTDHRSDLYSLGCVMYEALTGSPPFVGKVAFDTMLMHLEAKPLPIQEASMGNKIDPRLEQVVMRLLAKSPDDRYQSMDELGRDLVYLASAGSKGALPSCSGLTGAGTREPRSHRLVYAAIAAASLSVLLGGAFLAYRMVAHPSKETEKAKIYSALDSHQADYANYVPRYIRHAIEADGDEFSTKSLSSEFILTDDDLKPFKDRKLKLRRFSIPDSDVTDKGLDYLNELNLKVIDLSHSKVKTLAPLEHMHELEAIYLHGTKIDKSAFPRLSRFKKLRELDLAETAIDAEDLAQLKSLPQLTVLKLLKTKLPPERIVEFKQAKPDCQVIAELPPSALQKLKATGPRLNELMAEANRLQARNDLAKASIAYEVAARACANGGCYEAQIACQFSKSDCLLHMGKSQEALDTLEKGMKDVLALIPQVDPAWRALYFFKRANVEETLSGSAWSDMIIADRVAGEHCFSRFLPRSLLAPDYQHYRKLNLEALVNDLAKKGEPPALKASAALKQLLAEKDKTAVDDWQNRINEVLAPFPEPTKVTKHSWQRPD